MGVLVRPSVGPGGTSSTGRREGSTGDGMARGPLLLWLGLFCFVLLEA